jgi:PAS domain S-box-containing protein
MNVSTKTPEQLLQEIDELRRRLEEAEDIIQAIRADRVDAFVVAKPEGERVLTLESADGPFRILVERMRQGAATLSADGVILYCNARFADLLRLPLDDVIGAALPPFIASDCRAAFDALLAAGRAGGSQGELTLHRADGTRVPVHISVNALLGREAVVCLIVTDLTEQEARRRDEREIEERKKAEEALRRSQQRLELAQKAAHIGVFEWIIPTDEVLWAGEQERIFGLAPGSFSGRRQDWQARLHPEDRQRIETEARRAIAEHAPLNTTYRIIWPDGSIHWIESHSIVTDDETGRPQRMIGVNVDVTERKRLEDELRRRMDELAEADRRKDEFLALLAHELRNPLGPIRNAAQILKLKGPSDPTLHQARDMIDRQVGHMARLIDDLLDVSRIARGKILLHQERLDLTALVVATIRDYQGSLESSGLRLELQLPDAPLWVTGDPTRLAQVLSNVLNNAAKFTDGGGRVTVRLTTEAGWAVLSVRDTGIGMTPETLARLFEAYSQADRSLGRSRGGLGLGLALVKGLVELHSGTVSATSDGPGHGSEITIRLPLQRESAPPKG